PPEVERPKAKPHLTRLRGVRVVTWSIYGTLLAISGGELYLAHPNKFVMDVALDKTIQEFKMWGSMSRKPGQPADYLAQIYDKLPNADWTTSSIPNYAATLTRCAAASPPSVSSATS